MTAWASNLQSTKHERVKLEKPGAESVHDGKRMGSVAPRTITNDFRSREAQMHLSITRKIRI
jgi:hypothetical protein